MPIQFLTNKYALDLLQKNADREICADCTEKPRRLRIFFSLVKRNFSLTNTRALSQHVQ